MMVKGNNHSILRNTVFDTDPLNFESCDNRANCQTRDIAVYGWAGFGTCQCERDTCTASPETCCVAGNSNTYENSNSIFLGNGMHGFLGHEGGSALSPDTSPVDAGFHVLRSENNSAGALFEQVWEERTQL